MSNTDSTLTQCARLMRTIDAYGFDYASEGKLGKSRIAVEQELRAALAPSDSAPAPQASMQASELLTKWVYEGSLQTFEDRERFRAEARAVLASTAAPQAQAPEAFALQEARSLIVELCTTFRVPLPSASLDRIDAILAAPPQATAKVLTDAEIALAMLYREALACDLSPQSAAMQAARQALATPAAAPEAATAPSDAKDADLLFRFGGFLTSSERQWVFSSHDNASPMIDALRLFAEREGIDLDAAPPQAPSDAERDVLAERRRQVEYEGWTPEHDDNHGAGVMASAAACYVLNAATWLRNKHASRSDYRGLSPINWTNWPWDEEWWKPKSERFDLVRAGALILAEIERIDRAAITAAKKGQP